jgi:small subunit ribosomal protein S17e
MGRIKTDLVKRVTHKLIDKYDGKFTEDFEQNKKIMGEVSEMPSKKIRNTVAGYITRVVKQRKTPRQRRAYRPENDDDEPHY